jgi:hypothetical protein
MKKTGTKEEVFYGHAEHTKGGLTKAHLTENKQGKIVSKAKQAAGVKNYHKTLGGARAQHARAVHTVHGRAMLGGYLL